jgi:hypothetical protein
MGEASTRRPFEVPKLSTARDWSIKESAAGLKVRETGGSVAVGGKGGVEVAVGTGVRVVVGV